MPLEECFEEALLSTEPLRELRSLALSLSSQGQDKTAILAKFAEALQQLREANRESDENVVMDVMDCLAGWCSPEMRIPLEDEVEGEIVISIDPREADLDAVGVSLEEFEAALATTLDAYDQAMEATNDPDEITALDDAEIILGGKVYPLSAVADIKITSDLALLEEQNDDGEVQPE
jgi:hypothetical protein